MLRAVNPSAHDCAAILPCLNEARTIGPLVTAVRAWIPTVWVVDDGSTDATADQAGEAGARVLRHPVSRGKGAALRSGWEAARREGAATVLLMDGDGQHAPADIPRFFALAAAKEVALLVGNRFDQPNSMPWIRRATNLWMSRRLSALVGRELPDSQCGFRLADAEILVGLQLRSDRYQIESEMLVAFARAGHRIDFVPIETRYGAERSKIAPLRDGWRWCQWYRHARRNPGSVVRTDKL